MSAYFAVLSVLLCASVWIGLSAIQCIIPYLGDLEDLPFELVLSSAVSLSPATPEPPPLLPLLPLPVPLCGAVTDIMWELAPPCAGAV